MKMLTYPFLAICSIFLSLFAILCAPIIALLVQSSGYLPSWLSWFQTPDNPATGDPNWNGGIISYWNTICWLIRNPAQGFDTVTRANVAYTDPCKVSGNLNIADGTKGVSGWFLITCNGYVQFNWIFPLWSGRCALIGFGYRLVNIAKQYPHPTQGQIIATPIRFGVFQ